MLGAAQCGAWLTLRELSRLTRYGEASISAQLRHLRKPECGAYLVEKQRRRAEEALRSNEEGPVWEYRLRRQRASTECASIDGARPRRSRDTLRPRPTAQAVN